MKLQLALLSALLLQVASASQLRGLEEENFGDFEPQIVGGTEATPFKYTKWMVGMLRTGRTLPFCGASYIGKDTVLTAAHCVTSFASNPSGYFVEANRHNWQNSAEAGIKMPIQKVYVNPAYSSSTSSNDIAILKVTGGPDLASYPLLDDGSFSSEDIARTFKVIGWGTTRSGGSQSPKLLQAPVDLTPTSTCKDLYGDASKITESMICAKQPGKDTCQGDSGGPMFVDNEVPVIVGLTSWGYGCAQTEPGVYSRVAVLRKFVDTTLGCASGTTYTGGKCQ